MYKSGLCLWSLLIVLDIFVTNKEPEDFLSHLEALERHKMCTVFLGIHVFVERSLLFAAEQ